MEACVLHQLHRQTEDMYSLRKEKASENKTNAEVIGTLEAWFQTMDSQALVGGIKK